MGYKLINWYYRSWFEYRGNALYIWGTSKAEANHVIIVKIFVTCVTPLHFLIFIKYPGDLEFFRLVKPYLSRPLFITSVIS